MMADKPKTKAATKPKDTKPFTCEGCKRVFESAWTDKDADAEFSRNFPGEDVANAGIVCDDCYRIILYLKNNDPRSAVFVRE